MSLSSYRSAMLARKAAAAGFTVAELIARGKAQAERTRQFNALRYDREAQWRAIERKARAWRRMWTVMVA